MDPRNNPTSLSWRRASVVLTTALASAPAFAGHYDGPAVDVNLVNNRPAKYAECDQYLNDSTARRYAACEFGRDEAERMAERYAGGHGRIQGFLRGFAWGMHKMADLTEDDAAEIAAGARAVDSLGSYLAAGLEAGSRAGRSQGDSRGSSDAIQRFVDVLNTGRNPDARLAVPATNYAGEDHAYRRVVGPVPNVESIMRNDVNPGALPVYQYSDRIYLGEVRQLTPFELWFEDGTYAFEHALWYDKERALTHWFNAPIDTRPKFDNLNNPPLADAAGAPIDLKEVYKSAFRNSYSWYVSYHFSQAFHTNMDEGQVAGEAVGVQIGKRVAHYKGLEAAFDRKFKESSELSFRDAFVGQYTGKFQSVFADYLNNPKLSIQFEAVLGTVNDGIIQPGEQVGVRFRVKNLGGVPTPLNVSLTGDVIEGRPIALAIGRLREEQLTTEVIATIDPRLRPRDTARLVLDVNGVKDDLGQTVLRMIQVAGAAARLDASGGGGEVTVGVSNVSTVRTPGTVTATLKLNGREVKTAQLGFVEAGDTVEAVLPFANLDPLALIAGGIEATVVVAMNGAPADGATLRLAPANKDVELVKYFDLLANGRGLVPPGMNRDDRLNEVRGTIVRINDDETKRYRSGRNLYKHEPQTTMIGKVVHQFRGASAGMPSGVREEYHDLGKKMWPSRKNLRKFLFIRGPKRKAYENMCKSLSKSGKY